MDLDGRETTIYGSTLSVHVCFDKHFNVYKYADFLTLPYIIQLYNLNTNAQKTVYVSGGPKVREASE